MITEDQYLEINQARLSSFHTKRPVSAGLEDILYTAFPILDHGFIRVIDYMGNDESIVQAARVSYGKGTKKTSEDQGLINYLMRHRHTTPFEMCEIKYHVKLPIFVARQWIRHRTASVNEYSARYSILDNEFYLPKPENLAVQSSYNKQGRGDTVTLDQAAYVLSVLKQDAENAHKNYTDMLDQEEGSPGLARELARMNLSLNFYTQWYWKIDLHNLFHFLALRADPHAQFEIQEYANQMMETAKVWVSLAYQAFMEYRKNGACFSRSALNVIKRMMKGEKVDRSTSQLSSREWSELMDILKD